MRAISVHAVWLVAVAAWLVAAGVHAENVYTPTPINQGIGQATEIGQWRIQASAKVQRGGAEISAAGFSTEDWYLVSGRDTVVAGLLENGVS
jgi:exo-1,4-beta-D-glucosaminidase